MLHSSLPPSAGEIPHCTFKEASRLLHKKLSEEKVRRTNASILKVKQVSR